MTILHGDFETRGAVDLLKCGASNYARDPRTDWLCFGYAFDDEPPDLIWRGDPLPDRVAAHIAAGGEFWAHNAGFELHVWNEICARPPYGWPALRPAQCVDTAAMAAAMSLPRNLAGAAAALKCIEQKDDAGSAQMKRLSKPRRVFEPGDKGYWDAFIRVDNWEYTQHGRTVYQWWIDPERLDILGAYCRQDVATERDVGNRCLRLRPQEEAVWQLDWTINQRGVMVDLPLVAKSKAIVEQAKAGLDARMYAVTKGHVGACTEVGRIGEWLDANGYPMPSLAAGKIVAALEDKTLPPAVREVLELRQAAAKSSTAKLDAMERCADPADGRARGMFLYMGASNTGRFAGRLIQLQNLPRPRPKFKGGVKPDDAIPWLQTGDAAAVEREFGAPMAVISDCLRAHLISRPGYDFIAGDFASIEARVLAWLAGQTDKLALFRADVCAYCDAASDIYGRPITKEEHPDERQVGKVGELALGYQGGIGAFASMARVYEVDLEPVHEALWRTVTEEEEVKAKNAYKLYLARAEEPLSEKAGLVADVIKQRWRAKNDRIKQFWFDLEAAALEAVQTPGLRVRVGAHLSFICNGSFLWLRLPSGRALCFPYPKIVWRVAPWDRQRYDDACALAEARGQRKEQVPKPSTRPVVSCMRVDGVTKQWRSFDLYGGYLAENATQATSRDCLVERMPIVEAAGYPIILHVHDELAAEIPEGFGSEAEFAALMTQAADWEDELPIKVETWRGKRYRK